MKAKIAILSLTMVALLTSCNKEDQPVVETPVNNEYKYIRVLVSDENTTELNLVNPFDGTSTNFKAQFPKGALYTTSSKRYATIIHRENNTSQFFDTGLDNHGDHVDIDGLPRFGALVGESLLPTHFKSKMGTLMTFNDGDGTLSVAHENDIHTTAAKMKTINAKLLKHHGAMAIFSNNTYTVTEKDNSIEGTLPERVKIIDNNGQTIHPSTIQTKGIHGNATDGKYAVFGSASGILVVESNGNQKIMPYPKDFEKAWIGSILETAQAGNFIGFTATKGAYFIDVVNNTIKPIIENTDIMQCKTSYDNSKLGVLLHSGNFKLFDLNTLTLIKEASIINTTDKAAKQKPQIELTNKFIYVTQPATGELLQIAINNLSKTKKIKVSSTPYRITILGHETDKKH